MGDLSTSPRTWVFHGMHLGWQDPTFSPIPYLSLLGLSDTCSLSIAFRGPQLWFLGSALAQLPRCGTTLSLESGCFSLASPNCEEGQLPVLSPQPTQAPHWVPGFLSEGCFCVSLILGQRRLWCSELGEWSDLSWGRTPALPLPSGFLLWRIGQAEFPTC